MKGFSEQFSDTGVHSFHLSGTIIDAVIATFDYTSGLVNAIKTYATLGPLNGCD